VIGAGLRPDRFRISSILPDQLGQLGGDFGGYHDQTHRILLRPDVWSTLELILEGKRSQVDPYSSFTSISTYHHEFIHAAGPDKVGPMFGHSSLRTGSLTGMVAARLLEEAATELWNKRHFREFVRDTGLAERDARLDVFPFDSGYPEEVDALERVLQAVSAETAVGVDELIALAARHVPDTRSSAVAGFLLDRCHVAGTKAQIAAKADSFSQVFAGMFRRFDSRSSQGEDVGHTEASRLVQEIRGW
jgi:hypothetical protein